MSSLEKGLQELEQELRRVASMPPIAGGAPLSAEYALERIIGVVSNISPSGGAADLSAIAEDVLPADDSSKDVGSAAKRWAEGHFAQAVYVGLQSSGHAVYEAGIELNSAPATSENTERSPDPLIFKGSLWDGAQSDDVFGRWSLALLGLGTWAVRLETGPDGVLAERITIDQDGHIYLPSIPTADPVVGGALWNDAGTLKVSTG